MLPPHTSQLEWWSLTLSAFANWTLGFLCCFRRNSFFIISDCLSVHVFTELVFFRWQFSLKSFSQCHHQFFTEMNVFCIKTHSYNSVILSSLNSITPGHYTCIWLFKQMKVALCIQKRTRSILILTLILKNLLFFHEIRPQSNVFCGLDLKLCRKLTQTLWINPSAVYKAAILASGVPTLFNGIVMF